MRVVVKCKECSHELEIKSCFTSLEEIVFEVEVCDECNESFGSDSYNEGYKAGCEEGFSEGEEQGYNKGYEEGLKAENKQDENHS